MIKYGILGVILILVAAAVVATFRTGEQIETIDYSVVDNSLENLGQGDLEQRLVFLEDAIIGERQSRIKLEADIGALRQRNEEFAELIANMPTGGRGQAFTSEDGTPADLENIREQIAERRNISDEDIANRQIANLVEAGFDEFRAEEIMSMTEEMQMDLLNARYEATQNDERFDTSTAQADATQNFRDTLGEADYEKFLVATNQSTSVGIRNVLESSPAQIAGLQTGDEIVSYNGERVYNNNDLTRLSGSTEISGNVIVEVMRDGVPTSVSLPVGPIGITSGGNNRGGSGR